MKRALLLVALLMLIPSVLWCDTTVQFSTSGTFAAPSGCSGAGGSVTCGGMTITFTGVPANTYVDIPTDDPALAYSSAVMGTFQTSGTTSTFTTFNVPFTLVINQTLPDVASGDLTALVSGRLRFTNSQAFITFDSPMATSLAGVTYDLAPWLNANGQLALNPPTTGSGISTLYANVSVPEPGAMLMFGTGLTGLAGLIRRRLIRG